jgi:glycosyltransferase involved in cell wall biosynthesis
MAIIRVFQKIRKLHPSIFLQVVGSLRNQPVLRESYEELESTGIHFSGEISYEQVSLYMKQSDCLILFSHMENSPCVIGEALCSGLQVIASDVGGVKELIDLECCQLVQAGDEEALYVAMLKALDRKVLIDRFGVAERAHAKFSYKVVGESIYQAYAGLHLERTELSGSIS